ncbi:hypothetical protein ACL02T_12940 [Pseudonocardia sp. RS010]|uniref:hypothetical protein n=1 Tax=Pseudonocardia sp. RS010 TaxID=3385979 RepID=UPI0039A26B19
MSRLAELRAQLPAKARAYLDLEDSKYSEWATVCSIATYCMNAELTEDDFVTLVLGSDFADILASENGRDRSERLHQRLGKAWAAVEEAWQPPIGSKQDLRERLVDLHETLRAFRFPGRGHATDRTVSLAVVEYCHELGAYTPLLTTRFVSTLAGVSHSTANRSLGRLTDLGLLADHGVGDTGGTVYRLNVGWTNGHTETSNATRGERLTCPTLSIEPKHPAFLNGALGSIAGRLYFELDPDTPVTATEAAKVLGLNRKTVERNLTRLVDHGLFRKCEGRPAKYVQNDLLPEDLDEIAKAYGTFDWHDRQSEKYARQRECFAEIKRQKQGALAPDSGQIDGVNQDPRELGWVCVSPTCQDPFCEEHGSGIDTVPTFDPFADDYSPVFRRTAVPDPFADIA